MTSSCGRAAAGLSTSSGPRRTPTTAARRAGQPVESSGNVILAGPRVLGAPAAEDRSRLGSQAATGERGLLSGSAARTGDSWLGSLVGGLAYDDLELDGGQSAERVLPAPVVVGALDPGEDGDAE